MALTARSVVRRNQTVAPCYEADELPIMGRRRSLVPSQQEGTRKQQAVTRRSRPVESDVLGEEEQFTHRRTDDLVEDDEPMRYSTRGVESMSPRTRRTMDDVQPEKQNIPRVKIIGFLLVVAIVVWGVVWAILSVVGFCTDVWNTYHYGPTRTSVVSGVFGIDHDSPASPTLVIAINVQGMLVIESLPAGDVSKLHTYSTGLTLVGENAAKLPIILTIKDVNGDHQPDVLIEIPGQGATLKLINTGTGFTLTK